ncbi:MAG: hypothetical protein PHN82_07675 [bacterium]|nr:hypothetical protein [bacterium]
MADDPFYSGYRARGNAKSPLDYKATIDHGFPLIIADIHGYFRLAAAGTLYLLQSNPWQCVMIRFNPWLVVHRSAAGGAMYEVRTTTDALPFNQ